MTSPKFKLRLCVYCETVWLSESEEPLHEVSVLRHGVHHLQSFDVLLTVHLSIILVINQLNAQNLLL